MEETLKEILRTLKDYGVVLRHVDQRFDTLEKMIELVRSNQAQISERESAMEAQCRAQHCRVDDMLQSLSRRITNLESKVSPIPESSDETATVEERP